MLTLEKKTVDLLAHSVCPSKNEIMTISAEVDEQTLITLALQNDFYVSVLPKTFNEMLEQVENNPFIPIHWSKARVGRSDVKYHNEEEVLQLHLKIIHEKATKNAINMAYELDKAGNASDAYRLLVPFVRHKVILTSTKWEKYFKKHCPQYLYEFNGKEYRSKIDFHQAVEKNEDVEAQRTFSLPNFLTWNKNTEEVHIQSLAEKIWDEYKVSEPTKLTPGQWHMPFKEEEKNFPLLSFHFARALTVADHQNEASHRCNKYKGFLPHGVILGL